MPPVVEDYEGSATIETFTIFYTRDGSIRFGTVIARTPDGGRLLARVAADDGDTLARLLDRDVEPVGQPGIVHGDDEGLLHWRFG